MAGGQGEAADGLEHAQPGAGAERPGPAPAAFLPGRADGGAVRRPGFRLRSRFAPGAAPRLPARKSKPPAAPGGRLRGAWPGWRRCRGPHLGARPRPALASAPGQTRSRRRWPRRRGTALVGTPPVEQDIAIGVAVLPACCPGGEELPGLHQVSRQAHQFEFPIKSSGFQGKAPIRRQVIGGPRR